MQFLIEFGGKPICAANALEGYRAMKNHFSQEVQ